MLFYNTFKAFFHQAESKRVTLLFVLPLAFSPKEMLLFTLPVISVTHFYRRNLTVCKEKITLSSSSELYPLFSSALQLELLIGTASLY